MNVMNTLLPQTVPPEPVANGLFPLSPEELRVVLASMKKLAAIR